jgi:hypothetical protein
VELLDNLSRLGAVLSRIRRTAFAYHVLPSVGDPRRVEVLGNRLVGAALHPCPSQAGEQYLSLGMLRERGIAIALALGFEMLEGIPGAFANNFPFPLAHRGQEVHHEPVDGLRKSRERPVSASVTLSPL